MNTAGLLLFVLIGLFVVWLCHKADGDYIEANPDDSNEIYNRNNFGKESIDD